ncbi:DUF1996 domain-containing protein [Streptomyces sp. HNM0575]|nr:DUF1996 domain-containing protein [Streptomyces sp. HNM0575]
MRRPESPPPSRRSPLPVRPQRARAESSPARGASGCPAPGRRNPEETDVRNPSESLRTADAGTELLARGEPFGPAWWSDESAGAGRPVHRVHRNSHHAEARTQVRAHKRNKTRRNAVTAAVALLLSGGGVAVVSATANAGQHTGHPAAQAGGAHGHTGQDAPVGSDFVDITQVPDNVRKPGNAPGASTGTFTSSCGTNAEGRHNSDNVIVAPGVGNGAHHTHDYVGNKQVDAGSTDESLAAQGTTCTNGDQSTYYWPVLRDRRRQGEDADKPGGGAEDNVGSVIEPAGVDLTFRGSPRGDVVAMPRFLRIITGDAKASTNGGANANASWSCTGFEDKVQLKDKYPICPDGSRVVRTASFQSCWDGKNTDSADHRAHVAFAGADGSCPGGFKAVPQLVQRLTYDVPDAPDFAVDSFPEQKHKPVTDHGDFINVMTDDLMNQAVDCINSGRRCG